MSGNSEYPKRYMTPKEYLEAQRERGGCAEDFKANVIGCTKTGIGIGIPFGLYAAYRSGHRSIKPFASTTVLTALTSTVFFGAIGVVIGTFDCLRLRR